MKSKFFTSWTSYILILWARAIYHSELRVRIKKKCERFKGFTFMEVYIDQLGIKSKQWRTTIQVEQSIL